ncbi:MAG: tetratricopeptide repeat protein [Blastocatellia bacterium]|nr:tetratricopeptide repeat protein [Blastocatellia bacterium]
MSKHLENEHKIKLEQKLLSKPMITAYCPDSDILLLKCSCCDKVTAYCCDCSPILSKFREINNYNNVSNISHKPNNAILSLFDINSNNQIDNIAKNNIKNEETILSEKESKSNINDNNNISFDSQNINALANILFQEEKEENKEKENKETTSQTNPFSQQEIMQFCYKVENKIGEINLGANYYQILELSYKASRLEIQNAYLKLLSDFDITKFKNVSIDKSRLEQQTNLIIETINKAARTLLDESNRNSYDEHLFKAKNENNNKFNDSKIILKNSNKIQNNISNKKNTKSQIRISKQHLVEVVETKKQVVKEPNKELKIELKPKTTENPVKYNNLSLPPKLSKPTPLINKVDNQNLIKNKPLDNVQISKTNNQNDLFIEDSIEPKEKNNQLIQAKPVIQQKQENKPITGYGFKTETLNNARKVSAATEDLYALSLKCYKALNYERAASTLQKALELAPNNAVYWAQLAKTYSKIHNSQHRAESAYKEAIRICPDNIEYLTELANLYQTLNKHKQAGQVFERVFELKYQNSKFYRNLTALFTSLKSLFSKKAPKEKQPKVESKLVTYYKEFTNLVRILLIVIGYKLSFRKEENSSTPDKK